MYCSAIKYQVKFLEPQVMSSGYLQRAKPQINIMMELEPEMFW